MRIPGLVLERFKCIAFLKMSQQARLLIPGYLISELKISRRDPDLKPCAFARLPRFDDGAPGDTENFPGEKKAKTRIFEILAVKDCFFEFFRDAFSIIFTNNSETVPATQEGKGNPG
jgi:hypothetical protein